MLAWHFCTEDRMTRFAPRMPIVVGETLTHDGPLVLCESGLHASVRAIDALKYAPGPIVCRVELGGNIRRDTDKCVAEKRTCLAMIDATTIFHEFACCCAEVALLIAEVDDSRCWQAIEAKRAWLRGEIDDHALAAPRDAARAAAWDAARAAAWDAAGVAARDAAWVAAGDAAWDAAWVAAGVAAGVAARAEQNTLLESMLNEAMHP
jgi:hypothetical protein